MAWIWQLPDWPGFRWSAAALAEAETRFALVAGRRLGAWRHLGAEDQAEVEVLALTEEATSSAAIEGEILDRDSVRSSIRRHFGLTHDKRNIPAAEADMSDLLLSLHQEFDRPLDHETLFGWHRKLMRDRPRLSAIGAYRSDPEPMQIVSGPIHQQRVHYEAPPSDSETAAMDDFVAWFEQPAGDRCQTPSLTRAGIAHLYFVSIRPFEDGNGRIGRALAEIALARSAGRPAFYAVSAAWNIHSRAGDLDPPPGRAELFAHQP